MLGPALAFDEEGVGDDEEAADEDMSWWMWGARYVCGMVRRDTVMSNACVR